MTLDEGLAFQRWQDQQQGETTKADAFVAGIAYAATLRQQAGRVDGAMVVHACEAAELYNSSTLITTGAMRAALTAAQEGPGEEDGPWAEGWSERSSNAQNTQREGEAVAYIEEYDLDGRHCRGLVWADHPANTPGHTFKPLTYLHAERARVPAVDGVRFVAWMIDNREGCYVTEEGLQGWLAQFLREEAAAPSQRAEVK